MEPKEPSNSNTAIDNFVEATVESLRDTHHSELEPFEAYAARLKAEIGGNLEQYQERLTHGYQVLLEELAKEDK